MNKTDFLKNLFIGKTIKDIQTVEEDGDIKQITFVFSDDTKFTLEADGHSDIYDDEWHYFYWLTDEQKSLLVKE